MQYQQPNSRRRTVHHDKPSFASVDNAVQKSGIRSRPRVQYSSEMDEIEMARNALGPRNMSVTVARDGSSDIHSIANVQKLSMLQEVYPEFAIEVLEDVLIAAQFRIDFAASMLGELSRELLKKTSVPERVDLDWTTVQYDMETDDHWHEVSESRPEMQQWVMVQDDWEVVDNDLVSPPKTRSYADVLANGNCASNAVLASAPLPRIAVSTSLAPLVRQKNVTHETDELASDELSVKSFGARKRRVSRKFRRH